MSNNVGPKVFTIYKNGDKFFEPKPFIIPLSKPGDRQMGIVMEKITLGIKASSAVHRLYTLSGTRINTLEELEQNMVLVASGKEGFKDLPYGKVGLRALTMQNANTAKARAHVDIFQLMAKINNEATVPADYLVTVNVQKPRQIEIVRNGDLKGVVWNFTLHQKMGTYESFLQEVSDKVSLLPILGPVLKLCTCSGENITKLDEVMANQRYVAVDRKPFKQMDYASSSPRKAASPQKAPAALKFASPSPEATSPAVIRPGQKKMNDTIVLNETIFAQAEQQFKEIFSSSVKTDQLFQRMDVNENMCSLAEIDKFVVELFPTLNHKPALMRAYQLAVANGDDKNGDELVHRNDFEKLIQYIVFFNKVWYAFELLDSDSDRRLDFNEFQAGLKKVGLKLPNAQARDEFDGMDTNDGGLVLFDEFCTWAVTKLELVQ